ncbi:MAG: polysaccharide biosynthesis protein [Erysipelotrichaceae bacterium]
MKKNSFLEGAFIATASVVLCKVLGLIYVIPFYGIVGELGGALYSYAYSIYAIFLSLATVGIPTAISKIVSEYNALDLQYVKNKAYKIGSKIMVALGLVVFLVLFIFAPQIAHLIKGDAIGGNSLKDVTIVIRAVSTALLIVPISSVRRGYLYGHNFISVPQFSNVIEQVVRVAVVVIGSFVAYKVLHLSLTTAVTIAVLGATFGALISYFYVDRRIKANRHQFHVDAVITESEKKFNSKLLFKKIVIYALPFVLIDLIRSAYSTIDVLSIVTTLTDLGFSVFDAENVMGIISTWASKIIMIVTSVSIGITASLVPNIMPSFVKKDYQEVNRKTNMIMQFLIVLIVPMTIGLSFLAYPVWNAFYGFNAIGVNILGLYVYLSLTLSFQSVLIEIAQIMNNTRLTITTLSLGVIIKLALNVPMMYFLSYIGVAPYYGTTIASLISQVITIVFLLVALKKKYGFNYHKTNRILVKTLISCGVMVVALLGLSIVVPLDVTNRFMSIVVCGVYGIVGGVVYYIVAAYFGIIPKFPAIIKMVKERFKK